MNEFDELDELLKDLEKDYSKDKLEIIREKLYDLHYKATSRIVRDALNRIATEIYNLEKSKEV